ncbi:hypothetical protein B484DRAFT_455691 [Ochromonadaceae sp. CCMP2298]|nr:hypothetical protein B484DRAFT_455691 [Ochromonadaceae sp. CCMP2298]
MSLEALIFENGGISQMRARELRNMLVQKLGVDSSLIDGILDREELKEMASTILSLRLQEQYNAQFQQHALIATAVVGALTILYFLRHIILYFIVAIGNVLYTTYLEINYKNTYKVKLISFSVKKRKPVGVVALLLSLVLEFLVMLLQLSTLLSWVVPRNHILRQFLPPSLSLPVSIDTVMGKGGTGSKSKSPSGPSGPSGMAESISSFSLDVGPMVTIMALKFIINKLDEYSASVVLDYLSDKESRRAGKASKEDRQAAKKFRKAFGVTKTHETFRPAEMAARAKRLDEILYERSDERSESQGEKVGFDRSKSGDVSFNWDSQNSGVQYEGDHGDSLRALRTVTREQYEGEEVGWDAGEGGEGDAQDGYVEAQSHLQQMLDREDAEEEAAEALAALHTHYDPTAGKWHKSGAGADGLSVGVGVAGVDCMGEQEEELMQDYTHKYT